MKFFDYTKLSFSALVEKIGNSRYFDLPPMLEEVLNKLSGRVETLENAPAPSGGIESLSGDFVDNTDSANPVLDRGYKVYIALLSQSLTDAPVATILENTLGGTVVWSYEGVGDYLATLSGAFTENKTLLPNVYSLSVDGVLEGTIKYNRIDINSIQLDIRENITGNPSDDLLNAGGEYFVEIRVYN